jgi:hypothetical protein
MLNLTTLDSTLAHLILENWILFKTVTAGALPETMAIGCKTAGGGVL